MFPKFKMATAAILYLLVGAIGFYQWLICKKISVGTPSAEGARIEAP